MPDKKDPRYLEEADALLRLNETIVLWDRTPHYVQRNENGHIRLYKLPYDSKTWSKDSFRVDYNDEERLDIRSLPVGYVNNNNGSYFVTRPSFRKQKQGISSENLIWFDSAGRQHNVTVDQLLGVPFYKMLINEYPSYREALDFVKHQNERAQAFSREFCLVKPGSLKISLEMLGEEIGVYRAALDSFELSAGFRNTFITMKLSKFGVPVL